MTNQEIKDTLDTCITIMQKFKQWLDEVDERANPDQDMIDRAVASGEKMVARYHETGELPKIV